VGGEASEYVGLGFFTFSKFMMWRDLDAAAWPQNGLLGHSLLNILMGEESQLDVHWPIAGKDEPIDSRIDISRAIHVVDADSSQAVVVEEALRGRNLVVQGPPGTGKSQTITPNAATRWSPRNLCHAAVFAMRCACNASCEFGKHQLTATISCKQFSGSDDIFGM
jgi:hypothetical protein